MVSYQQFFLSVVSPNKKYTRVIVCIEKICDSSYFKKGLRTMDSSKQKELDKVEKYAIARKLRNRPKWNKLITIAMVSSCDLYNLKLNNIVLCAAACYQHFMSLAVLHLQSFHCYLNYMYALHYPITIKNCLFRIFK